MQSNGGTCRECGGWTERVHSTLCGECKREAKRGQVKECALDGCNDLFKATGASRYCMVHRGMSGPERARALRELSVRTG